MREDCAPPVHAAARSRTTLPTPNGTEPQIGQFLVRGQVLPCSNRRSPPKKSYQVGNFQQPVSSSIRDQTARQGCEMVTCSETEFLINLFDSLEENKVRYAVMRNYDALPESLGVSDLDILVEDDQRENVANIIYRSISQNNGVVLGVVRQPKFTQILGLGNCGHDWAAQIDIYGGVVFQVATALADCDKVLKMRELHSGIHVLPKSVASIIGELKELLHHKRLRKRYIDDARRAMDCEWEQVREVFAPLGERSLLLLREICLIPKDGAVLKKESAKLRRIVLWNTFCRSPVKYVKGRVSHQWSRVNRILYPPGLMLAIMGTDGSGKSTMIEAINPILSQATHGAFNVLHLRPGLLPPLSRFKGKKCSDQGPVVDPHGSQPSGILGSLVRLCYLGLDYVVGYWVRVRPRLAKRPCVVLFDRYAYDLEMDPRRFRIRLPKWLLRLATRMAPKPDLIFCLDGEAEEIQRRKQELPLEEVERQLAFIREFAARHPNAVLISTRGTVEETREQVLDALRQYCLERNPLNELS